MFEALAVTSSAMSSFAAKDNPFDSGLEVGLDVVSLWLGLTRVSTGRRVDESTDFKVGCAHGPSQNPPSHHRLQHPARQQLD